MSINLDVNNFGYFAFAPSSPLLSENDQKTALALTVLMGVFTCGVGHLISSIVYAVHNQEMTGLLSQINDLAQKNIGPHASTELINGSSEEESPVASEEKDKIQPKPVIELDPSIDELVSIAEPILLDLKNKWEKDPVLLAISAIPEEDREDVIQRAKLLLPDSSTYEEFSYISEIKTFEIASDRVFMLKTIAAIAPNDRDDVLLQASPLLKGLPVYHQVLILRAINELAPGEREHVISTAMPLLIDLKNGEQYALILRAIAAIPFDKREAVISQDVLLRLQKIKDGYKRAKILQKSVTFSQKHGPGITDEIKSALREAEYREDANRIKEQVLEKYQVLTNDSAKWEPLALKEENKIEHGGLNIIVDFIKSQSLNNKFNCFVCTNEEMMQEVISTLNKSNFEGKLAVLFQVGQGKDTHHMIPVLIERKKDSSDRFKINICIMDSLGSKGAHLRTLYNKGFRGLDIPSLEIFVPIPERQQDWHNCAMFSLDDVKQFFKNENFFDELLHFGRLQKEDRLGVKPGVPNYFNWENNVQFITNLPPETMKLAQTMSMNYMMANDPDRPKANEPQFDIKDRIVHKRPRFPKGEEAKSANMKAQDLFTKYLHVINTYIERSSFEDLEALSKKYDSSQLTIDLLEEYSIRK